MKFAKKVKFLKNFDLFGYPVTLTMKENYRYRSIFGGCITLLFLLFLTAIILASLIGIFSYQHMNTSESQKNLGTTYGVLELNQSTLNLALKFEDPRLNNWTTPYFNISLIHFTQFRNTSLVYEVGVPIPLKPCNKSDFGYLDVEFLQLKLDEALCPDADANLTVQGNYQENIFSYLQINIDVCEETNKCQSEGNMRNLTSEIGSINIEFFIANNIVDLQNISQPISRHLVSDMHFLIDPLKKFYTAADIFLSEAVLTLEKGFLPSLMPSKEIINTYFFNQDVKEKVAIYDSQAVKIAKIYFRKGPISYNYKRNFGDLVQELSYFAGIWSTGYVFLMIFITSYNKIFFINSLSNKLYNFPSQMKKKANNELKFIHTNEFQQAFANDSPEIKSFSQKIFEKIEIYLSYDRKNKISFFEMCKLPFKFLFSFCGCRLGEKEMLIKKSTTNLIRDLDIFNILNKLQELEKIKDLLFTPEQQTLLSFTPKPEILSVENERKSITSLKNLSKTIREKKEKGRFLTNAAQYNSIKPFEDLILAWKIIKNNEGKSWNINENLLKMFGEDLPKILDLLDNDMTKSKKRRNAQEFNSGNPFKILSPNKNTKKNKSFHEIQAESPRKTVVDNDEQKSIKDTEKAIEINESDKFMNDNKKNFESEKQILEEADEFGEKNNKFVDTTLYENLILMNKNISKICTFDILDKKDKNFN